MEGAEAGHDRTEGEFEDGRNGHDAEHEAHAGDDHAETGAAPGLVEPFQTAAQRPAEQQQGVIEQFHHAQACLAHGIVGGLVMIVQRDAFREGVRHAGAVGDDISLLPSGEPQLDQGCGGNHSDKQDAEGIHAGHGLHGGLGSG